MTPAYDSGWKKKKPGRNNWRSATNRHYIFRIASRGTRGGNGDHRVELSLHSSVSAKGLPVGYSAATYMSLTKEDAWEVVGALMAALNQEV